VAAGLSLAVCGAVAQASTDPARPSGDARAPKVVVSPTSTEIGGNDAVPPDDLGSDPVLDALAESCFDGDLAACDRLFLQAPIDSPYEEYGDTCGGRQAAGTGQLCGLESEAPSGDPIPPEGLGNDPELDALAGSCYAGDMDACDELYGSSDSGSTYQIYGDTCGGRQPENTGRYCTALVDPVPGTGAIPATTSAPPSTAFGDTTTVFAATTTPSVDPSEPTPSGEVPPPTFEPTGLGDDPTLDGLAESCYDGDLTACDDLYRGADPGSQYRSYGDSCAGRQAENSGTWCVDAFGTEPSDSVVVESAESTSLPPSTTTSTTVPGPEVTTTPPPTVTTSPPPTSVTTSTPGAIPPPTLEPTGLGTDPGLDELAQSCYDGDMAACDDLWRESDAGSDYRDFGDTCAGRQPSNSGSWCEDAFAVDGSTPTTDTLVVTTVPATTTPQPIPPATQQPSGLGDDPALDALAQLCFDGDMEACDELFDFAPIGSDYRAYGDTCAGRQEPGTFNYCHVVFPSSARS
jgi:hypothetical protein